MSWFRFLICLSLAATSSATTRHSVFTELADRARALPPEFAAAALLRIAAAPGVADVAWQRQTIEDAFHLAAAANEPFARHNWSGYSLSLFDKAYAQGLDAATLQSQAVRAMLAIDFKKARELLSEIPPLRVPRLTCDDALAYDVSAFYAAAGDVAARAFTPKEVREEEPLKLLVRYAADLSAPAQVAPVARMIAGASLKPPQLEALVAAYAAALAQLSGDDRSFSAAVRDADAAIADLSAQCRQLRLNAAPLTDAWRGYVQRQLGGARCADSATRSAPGVAGEDIKPASLSGTARVPGLCISPECSQLAARFTSLIVGRDGYGLTPEQKSTPEWRDKLRQYLAALADWTQDDDAEEYFQFKSRTYSELFELTPPGLDRSLVLGALLAWLQQNDYRRDHPAEWFYPVNTLIIHAFADPAGMRTVIRDLQRSADPVIALYAQLEQLLPRSIATTLGLL